MFCNLSNQQEIHAIFSVVSSECSVRYCTAAQQHVFSYMCKGSSKWHGMVTCFKQQAVIEFFFGREGFSNKHSHTV